MHPKIQPASQGSGSRRIASPEAEASSFLYHCESRRHIAAPASAVFAYLDDHNRLSSHMSRSSWMTAGSRFDIGVDAAKGKAVGSHIYLDGRVLGIGLHVDEVVTVRDAPWRKMWQTTGTPRLLVIAAYRMGYEITPDGTASDLRIFIDYSLPTTGRAKWVGRLFGRRYARWCTEMMADDAARHFAEVGLQASLRQH